MMNEHQKWGWYGEVTADLLKITESFPNTFFIIIILVRQLKTPDKQKPTGGEENCCGENETSATLSDLRCYNLVISSLNISFRANCWDLHLSEIHPCMVTMHRVMITHDHDFLVVVCSSVYLCCQIEMIDWNVSWKSPNSHRRYNHYKNHSNEKLQKLRSQKTRKRLECLWICPNTHLG